MTQAPPGWYPDPGAPYGAPPHMRYWDGSTWTQHLQPAYGGPPPYGATGPIGRTGPTGPTTADGQRLSGWWWRVLAQTLDGFFVGIASSLLTLPVQIDVQREALDLNQRYLDPNSPDYDYSAYWDAFAHLYRDHVLGLLVLPLVFVLAYYVLFLRWKSATPGKLICGLRVRLRERPGTLPWSTIGVRVAVQSVLPWVVLMIGLLSGSIAVLVLGYLLAMAFYALDALWATWNKNRQTIHDLAARTQVVKIR